MLNKGERKHLNSEGLTLKAPCCIYSVLCASVQSSLELTEKKKANKPRRVEIYLSSSVLYPTPHARGHASKQCWDAQGHTAAPQGVQSPAL